MADDPVPVRSEVVDALLDLWHDDEPLTSRQQPLAAAATWAEKAAAGDVMRAELTDALDSRPDEQAREFTAAMPVKDLLSGTPGGRATWEMICLQRAWPWEGDQLARAKAAAMQWSPAQRLVFERRFGGSFDAVHWPDAG